MGSFACIRSSLVNSFNFLKLAAFNSWYCSGSVNDSYTVSFKKQSSIVNISGFTVTDISSSASLHLKLVFSAIIIYIYIYI